MVGELIRRAYATGLVRGEDDELYDILPAGVTEDRGAYLAEVCREFRPATTVEVGMAWGLSTLWILKTLLEQTHPVPHVVMDPFQRFGYHGAAVRALRDNGLESMVEFYEEPSIDVLEMLAAEERGFDFAFIDGDHSYEAVLCDLWLLDPLIRPGGVIVRRRLVGGGPARMPAGTRTARLQNAQRALGSGFRPPAPDAHLRQGRPARLAAAARPERTGAAVQKG